MKKNVSFWQLFSIFYVFFLMTSIGGYCNVQIVYLLRDAEYFNMNEEYQGRVTSMIILVATICAIFWTTIAGYIYDIFARKVPILLAGLIGSFFLFVCPHTAPSIAWLVFVRAAI